MGVYSKGGIFERGFKILVGHIPGEDGGVNLENHDRNYELEKNQGIFTITINLELAPWGLAYFLNFAWGLIRRGEYLRGVLKSSW